MKYCLIDFLVKSFVNVSCNGVDLSLHARDCLHVTLSLVTRDSQFGVASSLATRDSHPGSNWPVCIHVIRILALIGGSLRFRQNGRAEDMLLMICNYCYCSVIVDLDKIILSYRMADFYK